MSDAYIFGQAKQHNRHYKKYRRYRLVTALLVLVMFVSAAFIGFDIFREKRSAKPVVSKVQKIERVAAKETFNTEYFQFDADVGWVFDEKESSKTKFVYRIWRGPLIEHQLDLYVNDPRGARYEAPHVLPVAIDGNKLVGGTPSEHCKATFPKTGGNRNPAAVKFANTSLTCNPDDIRYRLILGVVNAGNEIKLKRENGQEATYVITYQDLTYSNSGRDLSKIVNSFQAK